MSCLSSAPRWCQGKQENRAIHLSKNSSVHGRQVISSSAVFAKPRHLRHCCLDLLALHRPGQGFQFSEVCFGCHLHQPRNTRKESQGIRMCDGEKLRMEKLTTDNPSRHSDFSNCFRTQVTAWGYGFISRAVSGGRVSVGCGVPVPWRWRCDCRRCLPLCWGCDRKAETGIRKCQLATDSPPQSWRHMVRGRQ